MFFCIAALKSFVVSFGPLVLQVRQSLLLLVNGISALPRGTIVLQLNSEIWNDSFNDVFYYCPLAGPSGYQPPLI